MNDIYIRKFYKEVCETYEEEYKIILEPKREFNEDWIEYDQVKWELEDSTKEFVEKLLNDTTLSLEEKILEVYRHICVNYIYDDNVLYFFKTDLSDPENIKYIAVDWYGRIVGDEWIKNRKTHNRRICYEFSRLYAKAINILLEGNDNLEACIIGLKDNTHYVTAITGEDYSVVLDLDDFNNIKDLTRLKLGLTIQGIKILRDTSGKFQQAINKFNQGRLNELVEIEEAKQSLRSKDIIKYFKCVVEILNKYKLDSQGFCEYMRSIIENEKINVEKIWKEVEGAVEKRYSKCLIFNYNSNTYLLDSIEQTLDEVKIEDLDKQIFIFKPEDNEYHYSGK